jgi:Zn-dependent peptidase ImmA (M78 family)/predicted secreted protein
MEAAREHARLGTDLRSRIDIFQIIEKSSIWLLFRPLKDLYGTYQMEDGALGIIVNSNHPLNLQRFTAAHEYGHFVMKHEVSLDDAHSIEAFDGDNRPEEIAAQAFASNFLMPLQLVNHLLSTMGYPSKPGALGPEDVYAISLELGASYPAAVNQLAVLGKITPGMAKQLKAMTPKAIKRSISGGKPPEDPRADVWPLKANAVREIHPRVNDELHLNLPEIPSGGYRWAVVLEEDEQMMLGTRSPGAVSLVHDSFESVSEEAIGPAGSRKLVLRALQPGSRRVRIVKERPWEGAHSAAESVEFLLHIEPKAQGGTEPGLLDSQKPLLAFG